MPTLDPRQARVRRLQTTIARDEQALHAATQQRNLREVKRLTEDLVNRRAHLAELLAQAVPERDRILAKPTGMAS